MKQDIMLPKFNFPGQTSWLMRGVWIGAGVVLVQVVVVTTLLLRQNASAEATTTSSAQAAEMSLPPAPSEPTVTAPIAAPAPSATPTGGRPARAALAGAGAPGRASKMTLSMGRGKTAMSRFDRARGKGRRGDQMLARTSVGPRKSANVKAARKGTQNLRRNASAKPDDIDQLLRNFK